MFAMHCDLDIDMDIMDIDSAAVSPHRPYPEHFRVHTWYIPAPNERCAPSPVAVCHAEYLAGVLQAPDGAAELITPPRPIEQGNLSQQPPSNRKRNFFPVVDDEIELSEYQIADNLVRLVLLQLCARP